MIHAPPDDREIQALNDWRCDMYMYDTNMNSIAYWPQFAHVNLYIVIICFKASNWRRYTLNVVAFGSQNNDTVSYVMNPWYFGITRSITLLLKFVSNDGVGYEGKQNVYCWGMIKCKYTCMYPKINYLKRQWFCISIPSAYKMNIVCNFSFIPLPPIYEHITWINNLVNMTTNSRTGNCVIISPCKMYDMSI